MAEYTNDLNYDLSKVGGGGICLMIFSAENYLDMVQSSRSKSTAWLPFPKRFMNVDIKTTGECNPPPPLGWLLPPNLNSFSDK